MNDRFKSVPDWADLVPTQSQWPTSQAELQHFRNVIGSMVRDALGVWSEVWGEFEGQVTDGVPVLPTTEKGFRPECGWPEFLEKMCQLRFYLASAQRFCEQKS